MSQFRIETNSKGQHFIAGGILPKEMIKPGQTWIASGNAAVTIVSFDGEDVAYKWTEANGLEKQHSKENFSFQCRYCLVVDSDKMPEELIRD